MRGAGIEFSIVDVSVPMFVVLNYALVAIVHMQKRKKRKTTYCRLKDVDFWLVVGLHGVESKVREEVATVG